MTLPQLAAMNEYWADNPPVHVMVAAYLGIKKTSANQSQHLEEVSDLIPANRHSAEEFDKLMESLGLPVE